MLFVWSISHVSYILYSVYYIFILIEKYYKLYRYRPGVGSIGVSQEEAMACQGLTDSVEKNIFLREGYWDWQCLFE